MFKEYVYENIYKLIVIITCTSLENALGKKY